MKTWCFYSLAAAVVAAPVGWIIAGILAALANPLYSRAAYRPLYQAGHYELPALMAAGLALLVSTLVGLAKCSLERDRVSERAPEH